MVDATGWVLLAARKHRPRLTVVGAHLYTKLGFKRGSDSRYRWFVQDQQPVGTGRVIIDPRNSSEMVLRSHIDHDGEVHLAENIHTLRLQGELGPFGWSTVLTSLGPFLSLGKLVLDDHVLKGDDGTYLRFLAKFIEHQPNLIALEFHTPRHFERHIGGVDRDRCLSMPMETNVRIPKAFTEVVRQWVSTSNGKRGKRMVAYLQPWLLSVFLREKDVNLAHLHLYIDSDASRVFSLDTYGLIYVLQQEPFQTLKLTIKPGAPHMGADVLDDLFISRSYRFHLQLDDGVLLADMGVWKTYLPFARPVHTCSLSL